VTKIAVYPGSFDPVTNGHIDLIERSLRVFDHLIVAVANNPRKQPMFSVEERLEMLDASIPASDKARLSIDSFEGLLVQYAKQVKAHVVIRGLRAVSDFEFEFQMANMNRHLEPEIETVFMMTGEEAFYISSNFVREVAMFGGSVKGMVPAPVYEKLKQRFPHDAS
jgi:pantetheine-phosphate adenylyltransferase